MVFGSYSLVTSRFTGWLAGAVIGNQLPGGEFDGKDPGRHNGELPQDSEAPLNDQEGIRDFGGRGDREGGSLESLAVVAELGSIMILIATLTAGTEVLINKKKKKVVSLPEIS
jgi:hypothetical protein